MRQTDKLLFSSLFMKHRSFFRGIIWNILCSKDPSGVDDVLQATCLNCLPAFKPDQAESFRYWFAHCAKRTALSRIRRLSVASKHGMVPEDAATDEAIIPERDNDPIALISRKEKVELMSRAIEALEDGKSREVFRLWFMEGLAYKEVSRAMKLPPGTVMSKIFRSKAKIKQWIAEHSPELSQAA